MTAISKASFSGRLRAGAVALGLAGLLALAACDKGPDQAAVAAQLKGDVEAQLKIIEGSAVPQSISHTGVTVTPVDKESYQVTIEGLKFQPSPEGYLDIGTLSYVAKPKDETSYEVSDLKVAPELPFKGADGKEKGKLAVTTKSFQGLWSRDVGNLVKAEGEFADIVATDTEGADLRIAGLKFAGELTDKGSGLYDSTGSATVTGFAIKESASDGLFSIKDLQVNGTYEGIKLKEYQAAAQKYQELLAKQMSVTEGGQPATLTPEEAKALADAVAAMAASIKGGEGKFVFNGSSYAEAGATPFALETLSLSSRLDGINQEKANFNFDVAHKGLVINEPEASGPLAKGILPRDGNLGLKVTDIPSKDLVKVLADNLPGMMSADSTMAEANAMAMLVALQAVLQTSGAKIEVTPSAITADVTEVKADGNFNVSPQAVMGIAGALNIAWTGLDEVMALAQANPAEPNSADVSSAVAMLMQFAKRETGADGKPVDKFLIEVKETGELTVNGNPM
ncbi:MAG TPA: hypothetical protein VG742_22190 [Dongiaceae bacterium]|nr:hypothetical protein [Dongiaceae bacterium]